MYTMARRENVVRIPPNRLNDDIENVLGELCHTQFEGKLDNDKNLVVLVTSVKRKGDGRIIHGDGAVYQNVEFDALLFKPDQQEVVQGTVCEVLKFGAFIRIGPLDALLHISQVMDDRVDVDLDNKRLVGKDTHRDLHLGDKARGRIVTVSLNERSPRESKIGLTMRQAGLGKVEWLDEIATGKTEAS